VPHAPPPPPSPPRPRSRLGALTVSLALVVVGALLLSASLGVDGITATRVLAAAVLVLGLGLLVGARWGRARWLIALAVPLALVMGATASADREFGSASGDRLWVVDGSAQHRLGAGSATLDLRELAFTERRDITVEARVGAGELLVLVPEDLRAAVEASVGFGELVLPSDGGREIETGAGLQRATALGPAGARNVTLDLRVGLGELEVRVVPAE
jgi:hypothetical protein